VVRGMRGWRGTKHVRRSCARRLFSLEVGSQSGVMTRRTTSKTNHSPGETRLDVTRLAPSELKCPRQDGTQRLEDKEPETRR
jgi:hypothetical protein